MKKSSCGTKTTSAKKKGMKPAVVGKSMYSKKAKK